MQVKVLFFGATADTVGKREAGISFEGHITAEEAFYAIQAEYPQLAKHKLLFTRNQEYVKGDEVIEEGDELAVFTAVSGG
jgi:molybdopterin synthase sulfur carrier subunit